MSYIMGFVAAVPTAGKEPYRAHAERAAAIFHRHGALRTVEAWGAEVPRGEVTDFHRAVQAKDDETVVFSWIEWPDKATCDTAMEAAMEDMRKEMAEGMPFDGKRMIYGGFLSILEKNGPEA